MDKIPNRVFEKLSEHVQNEDVFQVLYDGLKNGYAYTLEYDGYQYPIRNLQSLDDLVDNKLEGGDE